MSESSIDEAAKALLEKLPKCSECLFEKRSKPKPGEFHGVCEGDVLCKAHEKKHRAACGGEGHERLPWAPEAARLRTLLKKKG